MSLQTLDTTNDIPDAYKLALSESRRWLVLAYTSRSTLGLRAQGIGLPELRKQLEEEEEVLFGFLRFRRRGIVLQYTNPDCSRVVKARAQVHLQTILNFFRDNDFLLETSSPKDITLDNIARLTNSTSTSTINSSKKSKRLTDIMEESPILAGEEMDDGQSSPASSEANSPAIEETPESQPPPPPPATAKGPMILHAPPAPRNKRLLRPLSPEHTLVSPPATPRSPLPPSPLRRTPSPTTESTKRASTEYQGNSYESSTSTSPHSSHPPSPVPTPPPTVFPPTPPPTQEKLRLLKALEIRRQKLSGKPIVKTSHTDSSASVKRSAEEMSGMTPPPSRENGFAHGQEKRDMSGMGVESKARMEAKRAAMEEYRRHIIALEQSGRDLLCGWVNFQSSTSLLWRRKFIRITFTRDLILSETEESTGHGEDKLWRWKIPAEVRGVEVPDRDEEQLPHSLRIAVERGGAVCSIACQTEDDLVNLRRVLGYCLNDEIVFSG